MSRQQRAAPPTVPRGVSTTVPREAPPAEPVFIGLGANLAQRAEHLRAALAAMDALPGARVQRFSPLYASAPVDAAGPDYLNAVAELGTALAPEALLAALQSIEQAAGRQRPYHHAPPPLHLHILFFFDPVIPPPAPPHPPPPPPRPPRVVSFWGLGAGGFPTPGLAVPHPRMAGRAFVLRPLA